MGKLSDTNLRGVKPTTSIRKYTGEDGLLVKVTTGDGMCWHWRITAPIGEATVTYGTYPKVGLTEVRKRHRKHQEQKRAGVATKLKLKGR